MGSGWQDGLTVQHVPEVLVGFHPGGEAVLGNVENVLRQVDATVTAWMTLHEWW